MNRGFVLAAVAGGMLTLTGCGDDTPAGPQFGDLVFEPNSPIEIDAARELTVELFNLSNDNLGPVTIGAGVPLSFPPEHVCAGLAVGIEPRSIQSISPDQSFEIELTFDFSGLTEEECPLATYEIDLNAAVGNQVLGSAQIRLDHTEVE